jgi:hypothetical protein
MGKKLRNGTTTMVLRKKSSRGGAREGAGRPSGTRNKLKKRIDFDNDISYNNIIDIITKCREGGVRNFKCGNLEIEFSSASEIENQKKIQFNSAATEIDEKIGEDETQDDNCRIAQMLIDDPTGFEQEIVDSHIRRCYAKTQN